jgi:hypothetical protein
MTLAWTCRLRLLFHLVLGFLLVGSMDLALGQQLEGDAPFSNDSGSLDLPPQSTEEMQESMPELQLFPPQNPSQLQPLPGDALGSPDL